MLQLTIPKPCHQEWNDMVPTSKGAFCSACAKEVIDFTAMTDEALQQYFLEKGTEKVCGKFNRQQLVRTHIQIAANVFERRIAGWKKYMAVLLLAFGSMLFGCDVTQGEISSKPIPVEKPAVQAVIDSVFEMPVMKGEILGEAPITMEGTPVTIEEVAPSIVGGIESIMGTPPTIVVDTISTTKRGDSTLNQPILETDFVGGIRITERPSKDTSECAGQRFY